MIGLNRISFSTAYVLSALFFGSISAVNWPIQTAVAEDRQELPVTNQKVETNTSAKKTFYTCGMHPEVIEEHPGNCPKCGMKLVPMSEDRAQSIGLVAAETPENTKGQKQRKILYWKSPMVPGEIHDSAGKDSMSHDLVPVYEDEVFTAGVIRIDPVVSQNMGVRTALVLRGNVSKTVRTVGFVNYDETSLTVVSTKVSGWIEKLYVEKTGAQIHKGDKLFELYSPELFSAQEEYLSALRAARGSQGTTSFSRARVDTESLVNDARTRLEYFDISAEQVKNLEKEGKPQKSLTILAPSTGIVIHKGVVQGQMVKEGEDLFRIADLSKVWVIAKVFESDLPYIKNAQPALMNLNYIPGKTFRGYVTYIYPFLDEKTREISVRIEFYNPGYELKPGMFATVQLTRQLKENAVLVPDVAVIDTGVRKVAFITDEPGHFQLRNLSLGVRSENNYLEVLSGLVPGEKVVISGQFMLDSESRLREAALKFLNPSKVNTLNSMEVGASNEISHEQNGEANGETYYACPMPEHVDTLYKEPGICPLCGMKLVPVPNPVISDELKNGANVEEHRHDD